MKLQIDFELKTIKLESDINFGEFVEKIQTMLPDWKEFKISTNTVIQWREYPVWRYRRYNDWPWNQIMYNTANVGSFNYSDIKTLTDTKDRWEADTHKPTVLNVEL